MSSLNFDPNGGDLGRGLYVTPTEFQICLPVISSILEILYKSDYSELPFRYAFEFKIFDKEQINAIIRKNELPAHVKWYEINGIRLFEVRGASGGITTSCICYLITDERGENVKSTS